MSDKADSDIIKPKKKESLTTASQNIPSSVVDKQECKSCREEDKKESE